MAGQLPQLVLLNIRSALDTMGKEGCGCRNLLCVLCNIYGLSVVLCCVTGATILKFSYDKCAILSSSFHQPLL